MLAKLIVVAMIMTIMICGCGVRTYEYYVREDFTMFGYQTPPLFLARNDAENILNNRHVNLISASTYREALRAISKSILLPIVVTGDESFLDKQIDTEGLEGKSAMVVLDKILAEVEREYTIEQGWVKVK